MHEPNVALPAVARRLGSGRRARVAAGAAATLAVLGGALATAPEARAATLVVTSTADDGGPGTLRAVLAGAADGDVVTFDVPDGSTIVLEGAPLVVDDDIVIDGSTAVGLTVDADGRSGVFELYAEDTIRITDLAVTGGHKDATGDGLPERFGGGIYAQEGWVELHRVHVFDNHADVGGGVVKLGTVLEITDSSIVGNTAVEGGGVFAATYYGEDTFVAGLGIVRIEGTDVFGNEATDGSGGGVYVIDAGAGVAFVGSTFEANISEDTGGGALIIDSSSTTAITGTSFSGNEAAFGGGLVVANQHREVIVDGGTSVTDNSATFDGGGIAILGVEGTVTVDGATFSGNHADGFGGGLLIGDVDSSTLPKAVHSGVDVRVSATVLDTNTAGRAGGLAITDVHGRVEIDASRITGNTADGGGDQLGTGGGGLMLGAVRAHVTDTTIDDNQADTVGGGLAVVDQIDWSWGFLPDGLPTSVVLERSTVSGNEAPDGAGIVLARQVLELQQSTVSGNVATGEGGGVLALPVVSLDPDDPPAAVTLQHSTVTANQAASGGGIVVPESADADVDHSILAGNTATGGAAEGDDLDGAAFVRSSLITDAASPAATIDDGGGNVLGEAPQLGPLADNGGPTETHLPLAASPAVDAGDPLTMLPITDQRGAERLVGDAVDIGSVERGEEPVAPPPDEPPPSGPPAPPEEPPSEEPEEEPDEAADVLDVLCDDAPGGVFTDVGAANVHGPAVECLAHLGIIEGGPGGLPEDAYGAAIPVTRAQVASFLVRLLAAAGIELAPGPDAFDDDGASVHHDAINALAAAGLVDGLAGGGFGPDEPVRRDQLASLLHRLHERVTGAALPLAPDAFDDDGASVHEAAVDALAAAGVIHGTSTPRVFDPAGLVRRDQLASFVVRMVGLLADAGHLAGAQTPAGD